MTTMKPDTLLWLDDHRGIYIPRDFASSFKDRDSCVTGVDAETWAILDAGPDHEQYWDAWTDVVDYARVTDGATTYTLYQEGALWLVPEGMEWDDGNEFFKWPDEEDEEDEGDPCLRDCVDPVCRKAGRCCLDEPPESEVDEGSARYHRERSPTQCLTPLSAKCMSIAVTSALNVSD